MSRVGQENDSYLLFSLCNFPKYSINQENIGLKHGNGINCSLWTTPCVYTSVVIINPWIVDGQTGKTLHQPASDSFPVFVCNFHREDAFYFFTFYSSFLCLYETHFLIEWENVSKHLSGTCWIEGQKIIKTKSLSGPGLYSNKACCRHYSKTYRDICQRPPWCEKGLQPPLLTCNDQPPLQTGWGICEHCQGYSGLSSQQTYPQTLWRWAAAAKKTVHVTQITSKHGQNQDGHFVHNPDMEGNKKVCGSERLLPLNRNSV